MDMHLDALVPALATFMVALALALAPRRWAEQKRRRLEDALVVLGAVLLLAVKVSDGTRSVHPLGAVLPLQVCDVSSIACVVALRGGPRLASALALYFGLDLSSIAIVFPDLGAGPASLEYWLFWLRHGVILTSALYLLAVLGYRPTWQDFWRWCAFGVVYIGVVAVLNRALGSNYAFIADRTLEHSRAVDAFGPWPGRAVVMLLLAVAQAAAVTWIVELLRPSGDTQLTSRGAFR